jgi:Family of unknown function (DUF5681)
MTLEKATDGTLRTAAEQRYKERGGITGKGFVPGQSGNPGGRPRGLGSLIREQTRHGEDLVSFVVSVLRDPRAKAADRLAAATWLADRGFGRPAPGTGAAATTQIANMQVVQLIQLRLRHLTDAELDEAEQHLEGLERLGLVPPEDPAHDSDLS